MDRLHQKRSGNHQEGLLNRLVKVMVTAYDWLSGPPMSEQERINRALAETRPLWDKTPALRYNRCNTNYRC